jgi:hypothetical protein
MTSVVICFLWNSQNKTYSVCLPVALTWLVLPPFQNKFPRQLKTFLTSDFEIGNTICVVKMTLFLENQWIFREKTETNRRIHSSTLQRGA